MNKTNRFSPEMLSIARSNRGRRPRQLWRGLNTRVSTTTPIKELLLLNDVNTHLMQRFPSAADAVVHARV